MTASHPAPIEPLESRRLFAVTALSHHVLVVEGIHSLPNNIVVGYNADGTHIDTSVQYRKQDGTWATPITKQFLLSDIKLVRIFGGASYDDIKIDQSQLPFPLPTIINAEGGRNHVLGGDRRDTIYSGSGNDVIFSGAGDDTIFSFNGNDFIDAGTGNDRIYSGGGFDTVLGGEGNDTMIDTYGPDTLIGGAGKDIFYAVKLTSVVKNGNDYTAGADKFIKTKLPDLTKPESYWNKFLDNLINPWGF